MKRIILLGIAGLLTASAVQASELVATVNESAKAKGQMAVALDLDSDGTAAAFSFRLDVPGLNEGKVNLKNVGAELPKGWSIQANATKGGIFVIANSDAPGNTLPKGVVPIGTVYFNRSLEKAKGSSAITVADFEVSNDKGQSVASKAKVAE